MLMSDSGTAVLGQSPLQSFKGSNFSGVPQPKLYNDSKSHDYGTDMMTPANEHRNILITAGLFIGLAYGIWHFMYER